MSKLQLNAGEEIVEVLGVSGRYVLTLVSAGIVLLVLAALLLLGSLAVAPEPSPAVGGTALPLGGSLLGFVVAAAGLYVIGMGLYLRFGYRYYLTNQRVISFEGIVSKHMTATQYEEIQIIQYRRDLVSRLFNAGTVVIRSNNDIELVGIENPEQCVNELSRLQEAHSTAENSDIDPETAKQVLNEVREGGGDKETPLSPRARAAVSRDFHAPGSSSNSPPDSAPIPVDIPLEQQVLPSEPRTPKVVRRERSTASKRVRRAQRKVKPKGK